jgi:hypothetical protein
MTDRRLQKRYLVTRLQSPGAYNVAMILSGNDPSDERMAAWWRVAGRRSPWARLRRLGLVVATLVGVGALAAACGSGSPSAGVASIGGTTTTTDASAIPGGSGTSVENGLLAYVSCMRTHGEPDMPALTIDGNSVHMSAAPGSGFDPNTPRFAAANKECKHLVPKRGGASGGNTITPADQAAYLKAVVCMRSHGVPNFPDPTFENNSVEFNETTPIDTNSPQYKSALATCQKLIPAGLPYSSSSGS